MGRASVPTPALYPAFFFVLKKAVKSAGNAVIPTFPTRWSHGPQHLRHKRRNVRFEGLRRVHTCLRQQDRTQRHTRRNRGVSDGGGITIPSERSARSQTSPGRVSERQTLPLLGLGRVYARRTQKACGTAMRLCASLSRGVAAPLACVIFLLLSKLRLVHPALRAFCACEAGVVSPLLVCSVCC